MCIYLLFFNSRKLFKPAKLIQLSLQQLMLINNFDLKILSGNEAVVCGML